MGGNTWSKLPEMPRSASNHSVNACHGGILACQLVSAYSTAETAAGTRKQSVMLLRAIPEHYCRLDDEGC